MPQTLLALLALSLAAFLMLGQQQDAGSHERATFRAEAEMASVTLADQVLDELALLPASATGAAPSPLTLDTARSLDEADGRSATRQIALQDGTASFRVEVEVERIKKQGDRFVSTADPTPFRNVRVRVEGPLDATAVLERVLVDLDQ